MNVNAPTASAPVAPMSHPALRLAAWALWIPFSVVLALLVMLASAVSLLGGGTTTGILAALAATALIIVIRRLPARPWARLAVSYAVLACALGYFANDDASVRQPARVEAIASDFPGARESYALLMRYGRQHPLGRDFQFQTSQRLQQGQGRWKPSDPGWAAWLTANRAELESGWIKLEPIRAWWAELNAFDRIGDLTPARSDPETLAYLPIRTFFQHACAVASLHALDGNGAGAMETLLPILELCRKLEPSSRTLIRSMVALVGQKMAIETAAFVLDTTAVSPGARARFANALAGGFPGAHGARRLVSMQYEWATVCLSDPDIQEFPFGAIGPQWMLECLRPLAPIMLNPRRTLNLYGELTLELQEHAARRAIGDIDIEAARFIERQRIYFKNFAGPALLSTLTPVYQKLLENYWKTEDLRTALQGRLQA